MKTINLYGVNYRVVKKDSNLGREIIRRYNYFEGCNLWDVYGSFSRAKINAYEYVMARRGELKGFGLVITSHNKFQFTCAFKFYHNDKYKLAYFTRDYNYVVCLEE